MPNVLKIFTDGSKTSDGCGCAFYIPECNFNQTFTLNKDTSIYTAESVAILEALRYGSNLRRNMVIYSDSQSVLKALQSQCKFDKLDFVVQEIILEVIKIRTMNHNVHFYWVKSHVGISHNETVDKLAKLSINQGTRRKVISKIDFLCHIKKHTVRKQWENYWKVRYSEKLTHYALVHPNIVAIHWYENCRVSRFYYTTIARLKYGHGRYPAHLYRIGIIDSPACLCGHNYADINHIIFNCHLNKNKTDKLLNELCEEKIELPTSISILLATAKKSIYDKIIRFLIEIGLKL